MVLFICLQLWCDTVITFGVIQLYSKNHKRPWIIIIQTYQGIQQSADKIWITHYMDILSLIKWNSLTKSHRQIVFIQNVGHPLSQRGNNPDIRDVLYWKVEISTWQTSIWLFGSDYFGGRRWHDLLKYHQVWCLTMRDVMISLRSSNQRNFITWLTSSYNWRWWIYFTLTLSEVWRENFLQDNLLY